MKPTKTGGGGTYIYTSGHPSSLTHVSAPASAPSQSSPAALPRTGGGAGGDNPTSPLAPLALIGGLAIVAGRFLPRLLKK